MDYDIRLLTGNLSEQRLRGRLPRAPVGNQDHRRIVGQAVRDDEITETAVAAIWDRPSRDAACHVRREHLTPLWIALRERRVELRVQLANLRVVTREMGLDRRLSQT